MLTLIGNRLSVCILLYLLKHAESVVHLITRRVSLLQWPWDKPCLLHRYHIPMLCMNVVTLVVFVSMCSPIERATPLCCDAMLLLESRDRSAFCGNSVVRGYSCRERASFVWD